MDSKDCAHDISDGNKDSIGNEATATWIQPGNSLLAFCLHSEVLSETELKSNFKTA